MNESVVGGTQMIEIGIDDRLGRVESAGIKSVEVTLNSATENVVSDLRNKFIAIEPSMNEVVMDGNYYLYSSFSSPKPISSSYDALEFLLEVYEVLDLYNVSKVIPSMEVKLNVSDITDHLFHKLLFSVISRPIGTKVISYSVVEKGDL